ncbi:MAG: type VI secretion system ATPase TssH [Gammaproteobacteria bacterium]|nr:type VI secretion system ATPase TssH [Gammaproteobacteria bacterium]
MNTELKPLIGRLNPTCRKAFETAAELCVSQNNYSVEIEHLLLKLLDMPNTDVPAILRYYEVPVTKLRKELTRAVEKFRRGSDRTPSMSPYILALLREAWLISSLRFDANAVRSGAMLLAMVDHDAIRGGFIETLPSLLRIPRESLRQDLTELVKHTCEARGPARAEEGVADDTGGSVAASPTPSLDQFTIDLTEEARQGRIDPIEGRDAEIRQIIDILTRRRQNNPILTGDAGVGKTAVVEGFALGIAKKDVPPALHNVSVRTLDLGLLQAGAGLKGEFENRLKSVINEVKASPKPIILFIDEAHTLIGAGGQAGQGDAANLLKPALARGELRTIAATTWSEYKTYFEKDPALTRRFQLVQIDEPAEEVAVIMLRSTVNNLEKHHQVRIMDEAIREAVHLSHRYISGRQLPDKAISVMDTACARVTIAQNSTPPVLEAALRRIARMGEESRILRREHAAGYDHTKRLEELQTELLRLQNLKTELEQRWQTELNAVKKLRELEDALAKTEEEEASDKELPGELDKAKKTLAHIQSDDPMIPACVDGHLIASVVSGWTGIPMGKMLTDEVNTILNIKEKMAQRLIGQPYALETIGRRVQTYRADLDDPGKPVGVFFLVGPSGTGKTETAVTLAELLYGGEDKMVTVNMSEYQEAHTVSALKGAPPGYVGYGKGGVLTEAVRRNPYSVVLLDEIEKAHPDVMELFFQVFDKGVLEDGEGVMVDFKNTLILLTSNVGSEIIMQLCDSFSLVQPEIGRLREALHPVLSKYFKPAFLGRLVVAPYLPLGDMEISRIAKLKLAKVQQRFRENHRAGFTYDESLVLEVVNRCTEVDTGARNVDHILTDTLLPALSVEILERMASGRGFSAVHVSCDAAGEICYEFKESDEAMLPPETDAAETDNTSPQSPRAELLGDLDSLLDWLKST